MMHVIYLIDLNYTTQYWAYLYHTCSITTANLALASLWCNASLHSIWDSNGATTTTLLWWHTHDLHTCDIVDSFCWHCVFFNNVHCALGCNKAVTKPHHMTWRGEIPKKYSLKVYMDIARHHINCSIGNYLCMRMYSDNVNFPMITMLSSLEHVPNFG